MYPVNSTIDAPKYTSTFTKKDRNCTVIDKTTGESCGEKDSLNILNEFQKLYETRIDSVDQQFQDEFERVSRKLQIMKEWVKDLGEQNIMLVSTVEDLEEAACSRVKLLEEKLKHSSTVVSENITKSNHTDGTIKDLSNRISQLEKDEQYMQRRIEFLQSDIRGLLELIRRARVENSWSLNGITFFEIQPNDIPAPSDCSCNQEDSNNETMQSLKLQIEQLQQNESSLIAYQSELEKKIADLSTKLFAKENNSEKSGHQNFNRNCNTYPNVKNPVHGTLEGNDAELKRGIVLTGDSVENMLVKKDLDLEGKLEEMQAKLLDFSRRHDTDINDLEVELHEKCKMIQMLEQQLRCLKKESTDTRDVLTMEVAEKHDIIMSLRKEITTLEKHCHHADMQIQFKEDIIKEMRKELKQTSLKDTKLLNHPTNQQEKVISYLTNTKLLMEKEKEALVQLKTDMEKILEKLHLQEKEGYNCDTASIYEKLVDIETLLQNFKSETVNYLEHSESKNSTAAIDAELKSLQNMLQNELRICNLDGNVLDISNLKHKMLENAERVKNMCEEKENIIAVLDSMVQTEDSFSSGDRAVNNISNFDASQQYKLMDTIRMSTIKAKNVTEDIRDEINTVISTFTPRHDNYKEFNMTVGCMKDELITTRENILDVMNSLQLQEEEGVRYMERIASGKTKLKDIKNQINRAQSRVPYYSTYTEEVTQEQPIKSCTEICTSDHLMCLVIEEIDRVLGNLQVFHTQGNCITSSLEKLKSHLFSIDSSIQVWQKMTDEILLVHETSETTLHNMAQKFKKLEREMDTAHLKIQDVLGTFVYSNAQVSVCINRIGSQFHDEAMKEMLLTKKDLRKLQKEYEDLKHNALQKSSYLNCDERVCQWKRQATEFQDQIRTLKHEYQCKQDANMFLRKSIQTLEEELRSLQTKAEDYRQMHSADSMELKKQIAELENTIRIQKETESTLRRHLAESEMELKKSKQMLNTFHTENSTEGIDLRLGSNQLKYEAMNITQTFKTLENAMQSTRSGFRELEKDLKKLICEGSSHSCSSTKSIISLLDKLEKYEVELNGCAEEVDKLKNALYSKDKLLENMDQVIRIQKDTIAMTQTELKELHKKLQEKIDTQDQIISQYEKEKADLLKQNELQIQTIGHLQNAVVEAKRCIDHMGQKTINDLQEKNIIIYELTLYAEEAQTQYNDCFAEAAHQDQLMEFQRDAINDLHNEIYELQSDQCVARTFLHKVYCSILNKVQEQLEERIGDFRNLKCKMDNMVRAKSCLEDKYLCMRKSFQETQNKYQELKKERDGKIFEHKSCQCELEVHDCITSDIEFYHTDASTSDNKNEVAEYLQQSQLQSEMDILIRENEDLKEQLQKYQLGFEIINRQLQIEEENDAHSPSIITKVQTIKSSECCLQSEHQQFKYELGNDERERLQANDENSTKLEQFLGRFKEIQIENNDLRKEIVNKEATIDEQTVNSEKLQEKLMADEDQIKEYKSELNAAVEMLSILQDRIQSLNALLKEKSDSMAKLQADYEVMKNDYSLSKVQYGILGNKAKGDINFLKEQLNEAQLQLHAMQDSYQQVSNDFAKIQEQLIKAAKREIDLQESLMSTEKDYASRLISSEKEETRLGDLVDELREELADLRKSYSLKNSEACKLQDICNSCANRLDSMQQEIKEEKEKVVKLEETNCCLAQQLQHCIDQNCSLVQDRTFAEQNNYKMVEEIQEMHKGLLDLKSECRLKNTSLECLSAELTKTALSRSELCKESQYVVSCIRNWMEEQDRNVQNLKAKLEIKGQQLMQLGFEKKALLVNIRELRRVNNLLSQRLKRTHKPGRGAKNVGTYYHMTPTATSQNASIQIPLRSNYLNSHQKSSVGLIKIARRNSVNGNPWWFPKMEYLTSELRKNNIWYNHVFCDNENEMIVEESRDCGYQSSTSK